MNKKGLSKACNKLWTEIGFLLHPFCEVCNKPTVGIHHFFPRSMCSILRFEVENGVGLCRGCHFAHHFKGDPKIHQAIVEKRGIDWYNKLEEQSKILQSSYKTVDWYMGHFNKLTKIYNEF
jgi:hypothetical protein